MFPRACTQCGEVKPKLGFYAHERSAGGRMTTCKECVKANVRKYRAENIERLREYDRQRGQLPHRKEAVALRASTRIYTQKHTDAKRAYRARNEEKRKAHGKVAKAIQSGKLIRPPCCERCRRETTRLDAHHEDYSKPLDVMWLCEPCHGERHREINAERRAKAA